jgi:hypothetical protein
MLIVDTRHENEAMMDGRYVRMTSRDLVRGRFHDCSQDAANTAKAFSKRCMTSGPDQDRRG